VTRGAFTLSSSDRLKQRADGAVRDAFVPEVTRRSPFVPLVLFVPTDSPDPSDLSRRDRERLARREAMKGAAMAVIAEKGYDGATLDEIAERAEFGKGTLYNYFPGGKTELFCALFEEEVYAGILRVVEGVFAPDFAPASPAEARSAFHRFVSALVEHFRTHRNGMGLFLREIHRVAHDPEMAAFFTGLHGRLMEAVTRPVAAAMAAGALRPLPAEAVAHLLMGNVRGYLMAEAYPQCAVPGRPEAPHAAWTSEAAADFITTVLFDGLLAGPSDVG
jgi:AcrR family transcriptional regulator